MKPDLHRFPLLVAWEMTRACLEDGALVGEGRGIHLSDGFGFVFVSSTGEVYPSGFLPLSAGNVRERPLLEIYRESPLFQELRNKALLKGNAACASTGRSAGEAGPGPGPRPGITWPPIPGAPTPQDKCPWPEREAPAYRETMKRLLPLFALLGLLAFGQSPGARIFSANCQTCH